MLATRGDWNLVPEPFALVGCVKGSCCQPLLRMLKRESSLTRRRSLFRDGIPPRVYALSNTIRTTSCNARRVKHCWKGQQRFLWPLSLGVCCQNPTRRRAIQIPSKLPRQVTTKRII
jgi:hypothetical protein